MLCRKNILVAFILVCFLLSCKEQKTTQPTPTFQVTGTISGWLCNLSDDFFNDVGENPVLEVYNTQGAKVYEGIADSGVFTCSLEADSTIFIVTTHYTWPPDTFFVSISADTSVDFIIRAQTEARDTMIFYLGDSPLQIPQELDLLHSFGEVLGDTVLQLAQVTDAWRHERVLGGGAVRQVSYRVPLINGETGNIVKAAEDAQTILAADTAGVFEVIQDIRFSGIVICDF